MCFFGCGPQVCIHGPSDTTVCLLQARVCRNTENTCTVLGMGGMYLEVTAVGFEPTPEPPP